MHSNPYDVLGLKPGVDAHALKRRYRERLRRVHPDLNPDDPQAGDKTQKLIEAYEYLSDPGKRADLDARLRAEAAPPSPTPPPKRPRRAARTKGPRPEQAPRRAKAPKTKTRAARGQRVVIINGQRIDVGNGGSVNVVMNNSNIHIQTGSQTIDDFGADVTLGAGVMSDLVMGDLHIRAGSTVTISGKVMGDVFVGAKSQLTISGKVLGDVHAKGSSLRVLGIVMGDLFVNPGRAEISGIHMGDVL